MQESKVAVPKCVVVCWCIQCTAPFFLRTLGEAGEDAGIKKAEQIPLGGSLGLEVPEDPALSLLLEDADLSLDVVRRICFGLL